jgi:hypothetical protein
VKPLETVDRNIYRGACPPAAGSIGRLLGRFGAQVVVGHPTFRNADNIGRELGRGIETAPEVYPGQKVGFLISDGTCTLESPDTSTLEAAIAGAQSALSSLAPTARDNTLVVVTPYDGYLGNNTPGKGSALKLIFEEMAFVPSARKLILLDGDLRNELKPWFAVFSRVEAHHRSLRNEQEFFVTARYARHFVDASLTRFVVGPLTTLMGQYVPGGISGDIVLSAGAVVNERQAVWDDHRRRYGTDIATTFDNIADPRVAVYEVYLGAKLHDITDEAKLSVMPGEVIGEALARLLHYEEQDGRISRLLNRTADLHKPITWGSDATGIGFIDPGYTGVFNVDVKREILSSRFDAHASSMQTVLEPATFEAIRAAHRSLTQAGDGDGEPFVFMNVHRTLWIEVLYQAIAWVLRSREIENVKHCLNYLYTAAFLEFCREKIFELGGRTLGEARRMQQSLGVPGDEAERFYRDRVDAVVEQMAVEFFAGRTRILTHLGKNPN